MKRIFTFICALAVVSLLAPTARASEFDKQTYLTFSGPVQLPGITLPAGKYQFRLAEPFTGRQVLQVWNADGTKLLTMLMTMSDDRMQPTDKPVVLFSERPRGEAAAVKEWFYPGELTGWEFIYPKRQATQIAKAEHTSVLSYEDESLNLGNQKAVRSAKVTRVDGNGNAEAATPTSQLMAANTASPRQSNTAVGKRGRLPRTASDRGLLELLAGTSFLGAMGLHLVRRKHGQL